MSSIEYILGLFFIHLSIGGHWDVSTSGLLWIDLLWTSVFKYLSIRFQFFWMQWFYWVICYVLLAFWGVIKLFPQHLHQFTFPLKMYQGTSFFIYLTTLIIFLYTFKFHFYIIYIYIFKFIYFYWRLITIL